MNSVKHLPSEWQFPTGVKTALAQTLFFAIICNILLVSAEQGFAQEKKSLSQSVMEMALEIKTGAEPVLRTTSDGSLKVVVTTRGWRENIGLLSLLESEEFLDELELSPSQRKSVKKEVKNWRKNYDQAFRDAMKASRKKTPDVLNEKSRQRKIKAGIDGQQAVNQRLNQAQRKRLNQLQFRFLVRTYGLMRVFRTKAFRKMGVFSNTNLPKVHRNGNSFVAVVKKELSSLQNETRDILLKSLSKKELEEFRRAWPYLYGEPPQIDRFRIHITFFEPFEKLNEIEDPFIRIDRFPGFYISPAGRLQASPVNTYLPAGIKEVNQQKSRLETLLKGTGARFELSKKQTEALKALLKQLDDGWAKGLYDAKNSRKIWEQAAQTAADGITKTLRKVQRDRLKSIPEVILAKKYGPVYDLLHGPLGKKLKLSDETKGKIRSSAEKAKKHLQQRLIQLEEKLYQKVLVDLPKAEQKKFRRIIGSRLQYTPPVTLLFFSK